MSRFGIALPRWNFYARQRLCLMAAIVAALCAATLLVSPPAQASPPTPPSASTARSYLSSLTVATEHSTSGYSRDLFPHWISQGGNCNTREVVLKRDGTGVTTGNDCYPTSGSWYSVYDGVTVASPSTWNSSRARRERASASSRVAP